MVRLGGGSNVDHVAAQRLASKMVALHIDHPFSEWLISSYLALNIKRTVVSVTNQIWPHLCRRLSTYRSLYQFPVLRGCVTLT